MNYCICANPHTCTRPIPGKICRREQGGNFQSRNGTNVAREGESCQTSDDHFGTREEVIARYKALLAERGAEKLEDARQYEEGRRRGWSEGRQSLGFVPDEKFLRAIRRLVIAGRTSGGVAGRDEYLCEALEAVEAFLPPMAECAHEWGDWNIPFGSEPFRYCTRCGALDPAQTRPPVRDCKA